MKSIPTKILVFFCHNLQLFKNGSRNDFARSWTGLKFVALPCSGKVEAHHLLKALAGGVQGVLVLACAESACQFLEGSMRSRRRLQYARTWLEELGIEPARLEFRHISPMDLDALETILREFNGRLQVFGKLSTSSAPHAPNVSGKPTMEEER